MYVNQRRAARAFATTTALALAAVSLAACGSSADSSSDAKLGADKIATAAASAKAAETTPTKISPNAPLSKAAPTGKLVVFIQGPETAQESQRVAIKESADAVGWKFKAIPYDQTNISTLQTGMQQALTLGADYVIVSGIPEAQLGKSTIAKFKSAGVPIVIADAYPVAKSDELLGDAGAANTRITGGKVLADWMVSDSKGVGKVLVENVTTYPALTLFTDSFSKQVKSTCPSCKAETLSYTIDAFAKGSLVTGLISKLRADRTIKYVLFDYAPFADAFDAALDAAGLDDVKVFGFGISPKAASSLTKGHDKAWVAFNFKYDGWIAMDIALRHSVGDTPVDPKAVTPYQLFTKENVGELGATAEFTAPKDSFEQFKKLWLVPSGS